MLIEGLRDGLLKIHNLINSMQQSPCQDRS